MRVVTGLWDSWSDDAVLDDRAGGLYARAGRAADVNHRWPALSCDRAAESAAGPQGRPVFVQAGSSETGRRFAARYAEAVFTAQMEKATAQDFYADLKRLVAEEGRSPRPRPDPAGAQPGYRLDRGRSTAHRPRTERPQ